MELTANNYKDSFKITKNGTTDLNVFFYKKGLINITRPNISYIKVDTASNEKPVYHIGSQEPMGHTGSIKTVAGVIMFEVFDGYPLQSLMFSLNNTNTYNSHCNALEDLPPLDLYVLQKNGLDPYGDYILKNVKFTSTQMEMGIKTPGRYLVARFTSSVIERFRAPAFFNEFVSDNYDYHIIRHSKEIEQIKLDIDNSEQNNHLSNSARSRLYRLLEINGESDIYKNEEGTLDLKKALDECYNEFKEAYLYGTVGILAKNGYILQIIDFIREFYKIRNIYMLKTVNFFTNPQILYDTASGGETK